MKDLKKLVALTVLGSLVVLLGGWFLLVSPKRSQAAELRSAAAVQVTANTALETQLVQLKSLARNLPREQAKLAAVAARVPTSRALPALIRALNDAAKGAGVELLSVSPGASTLVTPAVAAAAPIPTTTASPASPASPAGAGKPSTAVPADAGQLAQIPVTMSVVGGYFQVEQFVAALEGLQRSLRLTGVTMAPGSNPMVPAPGASAPVAGAPVAGSVPEQPKTLATNINAVVFMAVNRPAAIAGTLPSATPSSTTAK